jgi:hypothetical protein
MCLRRLNQGEGLRITSSGGGKMEYFKKEWIFAFHVSLNIVYLEKQDGGRLRVKKTNHRNLFYLFLQKH